jgi:hypothetical protein
MTYYDQQGNGGSTPATTGKACRGCDSPAVPAQSIADRKQTWRHCSHDGDYDHKPNEQNAQGARPTASDGGPVRGTMVNALWTRPLRMVRHTGDANEQTAPKTT